MEDEIEIAFDVATPSAGRNEVIELVSQAAAGLCLIWFAVSDLKDQLGRRRHLRSVP